MGLDHLLAALERDAATQSEALLAEARASATRLTQEADAELAARREEVLGAKGAALRAARAAALAETRRQGRHGVLAARERLLDRVFTAATRELAVAGRSPAQRATLRARLDDALSYIGDGPVVIRCPASLEPAVRETLPRGAACSVAADGAVGSGFRITRSDGTMEIDETLEARLARLRPELAVEIVRRLADGDHS